ncbi:hypothetical protein E1A91_A03G072400v1 [Gossypium mustelinum]|uniref:ZZ-type domain-containing protein n=1 Tax=Gossypium mustelinum TaxID=34275 RepID=A0A5D2ZWW5_GOSMU|nr:hypothetical protein E1A91_A03G072400v1 [Gossypium mustelinum]
MESNLVIKVKYGNTLRRFNARIVDGERLDLNMTGLRAKIMGLFNFPFDTELTLTYIDEDGDIVTLVDDDDLCDVMRQRLKFLRINVQLNNDKLNKPYTRSSGGSTPLRSPSVQPPLPSFNTASADALNSVPVPLRDALTEVFSKLSVEVASKASSASPLLGDLLESLSKMGQSYLSPASQPGVGADSGIPVGSSESPSGPYAPTGVLPKFTAVDSSFKTGKEANTENAADGVDVPAVSDPAAVDLNADPLYDANLTGYTTMPSGPSASNICAHNDKKNTKENNGRNKGKSVSMDASTPFFDTTRKDYPSNECPFSGVPVANGPTVPPFSYHPFSPSKRSFVSTDGNVLFGTFHKGVQCDGCGVLPITGPRFKSKVKDNYDLCSICFSKMGTEADYIRMDKPMHYRHPWCFRASNDHVPRVGPALPHVLRNRVLKLSRPKLESHFILDVNVLDGTVMAPSTPFTKIWRMRNNGTLPWYRGMQLVWIGGDKLTNAISVDIDIPAEGVPLDGDLDIAVDFTAPELPGRYVSYWRMASESGIKFGQRVWVLIHVDASLKDSSCDNLQGFNLNLPPESSGQKDSHIADMNADFVTELCSSGAGPVPVKHMVTEQSTKEQTVNNSDVPDPVPTSSFVSYPIIDQGVVVPVSQPPIQSSSEAYPISDQGFSVPAVPQTPSSSVSYPIIDFSEAAPVGPSQVPDPAISVQAPSQGESENVVEQSLLKELEDMGFKQVDLNKDILRRNEYDLEKSVDDLCGVAEWDPILEELQEMGFCDAETNKKLLKKNNGSIKGVVMDLLTGEGA